MRIVRVCGLDFPEWVPHTFHVVHGTAGPWTSAVEHNKSAPKMRRNECHNSYDLQIVYFNMKIEDMKTRFDVRLLCQNFDNKFENDTVRLKFFLLCEYVDKLREKHILNSNLNWRTFRSSATARARLQNSHSTRPRRRSFPFIHSQWWQMLPR